MPPKSKRGRGAKVEIENVSYQPPQSCSYDWPLSFHQIKKREYQSVESLIPGQIYTLSKFLNAKVCDDLIKWFSTYLEDDSVSTTASNGKRGSSDDKSASSKKKKGPAANGGNTESHDDVPTAVKKIEFSTTEMPPRKNYASRVNDRAAMVDRVAARILWAPLRKALLEDNGDDEDGNQRAVLRRIFGSSIGLNENFRVYRYRPGHYFGQHYDESNFVQVEDMTTNPEKPRVKRGVTKWTLLIYLTGEDQGEVAGGATMFYPEIGVPVGTKYKSGSNNTKNALQVNLEKGTMLLHKHGQDCLLHEGALVTSGAKWVLRTDLVFPML